MEKLAGKTWRDAATLILTAKTAKIKPTLSKTPTASHSAAFDYKVLMLKRSSKSKFMPNAFVFPGGVISKEDFSSSWIDLFKNSGHNQDDLDALVLDGVDRPLLMEKASLDEVVSRDIAVRLAAIRETFEESGILVTKSDSANAMAHSFSSIEELSDWRTKVHKDPGQLCALYKSLGLVPDLWSLKEWSCWLTPTDLHEQGKRRFDTLFYTTSLDSIPDILLDNQEVTDVKWTEPSKILESFYNSELWLAPPQVYELSRLLNFPEQDQLVEFSAGRHGSGCKTWLPIRLQCQDGTISLLPGDSFYPESVSMISNPPAKFEGTVEDCARETGDFNRLVFRDMNDCLPIVSIPPANGHVNPIPRKQQNIRDWITLCQDCPEEKRRFCFSQAKDDFKHELTNTCNTTLMKNRSASSQVKFNQWKAK